MEIAGRTGGMVINVDSLQVYRDMPILTARPTGEDEAAIPHALYGYLAADELMSAGRFTREVSSVLDDCRRGGLLPILCGGTGLYFSSLLGRLDEMPEIPQAIRTAWRGRLEREGAEALHAELGRIDPVAAGRIMPRDGQRVVRALEVFETSGKPLSAHQKGSGTGIIDAAGALKLVLAPERELLHARIEARFDQMLAVGALAEVQDYLARRPETGRHVEKAIGCAELGAVLAGNASIEEARERAVVRTRQYAKRQETWFRRQFGEDWLRAASVEEALALVMPKLAEQD
ncbi:tRNA (adenosine(37)-N6)-dimethylallyltransferase MiaA [Fulvimarina endophytica]|nr:tRNA (adenosine(37)-N6)-dimethylallyltransferase MiaA [Fulvimarina endophytica]